MNMAYTTQPCIHCGRSTTLTIQRNQFERWQAGAHVQHVWPTWSADERELMMTGIHPECWDAMFPSDEEDDEEREA